MSRFYSADDMIKCATRELGLRRRVYPNWVEAGRMTLEKAEWETECMEAIVKKLTEMAGRRGE
jgi:hypothetical protein